MTERVAIYVDGSNVYFAQKEALGWWIDWPRFLDAMQDEEREVVSARWYQIYRTDPEPEQIRFLHHLALVGFAVRRKLLKQVFDRNSGGSHLKGNLNLDLAIDALNDLDQYDTAILVTGDSEFEPLVQALQARGKRVIVMATSQNVAMELRNAVGVNYEDLAEYREDIESGKRPPERPEPVLEAAQPETAEPEAEEVYDEDEDDDGYDDDEDYDDDDEYDDEYEDEYDEGGFDPGPGAMPPDVPDPEDIELPLEGEIVRCKVQTVKRYGAFLDLHQHAKTLLHVKDMNRGFVPDASEFYKVGQEVAVQVVSIDRTKQPPEVRVQVTTAEMEY